MSANAAAAPPESDVPLFDVVVKMPSGARLDDIERLGRDVAGVPADRLEALLKVLRSVPEAKIGAAVSRERADKAKDQFTKAGLTVVITPVLSLQTMSAAASDGTSVCPACNKRVMLPENRQCPSCHVFVDKVTDEFLLKRKLQEQERMRLEMQLGKDAKDMEKRTKETLEAALRAKIREELEEEYGVSKGGGFFAGRPGLVRGLGLLTLLAAAFAGGNMFSGGGFGMKSASASSAGGKGAPADVDKMLDTLGPAGAGGPGAATAGAAGANGGPPTGDADIDDPLIQAAGGKRIGAKGLTLEQAVGAANILAKSVGNNSAERHMNGTGSLLPGAGGAGAAAGAGGAAGGAAAAPAAVPRAAKLALSADFARRLAELGQQARAREVIKALKATPNLDAEPGAAAAVRAADIEVQAWALHSLSDSRARQAADALKSAATGLPDAAERARALTRAGVVLSQHPQLPPEVGQAFLTLASDAVKTISDGGQRSTVFGVWAVGLGEALTGEITLRASAGQWARARAAAAQVESLVKQAPDDYSRARLHALESLVHRHLGEADKSAQSLDAAIAAAGSTKTLGERGAALRDIAWLSGTASNEKLQAAVAALQAQAQAAPGMERAEAMKQLALLHADAGARAKTEQYRELAQSTPGLAAGDTVTLNTSLIAQGDMAAARALHRQGLYAESEAVLQRLGGYLL